MNDEFTIGQHDTGPALIYQLYPPVNLTGATVRFTMKRQDAPESEAPFIDSRLAAIEQANPAIVRQDWIMGDTATPGSYWAQFEVVDLNGKNVTYPNTQRKIPVIITRSL